MSYTPQFYIGQSVYLTTDREQSERIVTAVIFRQYGECYELACGSASSWHYPFEISEERDIIKTTTN